MNHTSSEVESAIDWDQVIGEHQTWMRQIARARIDDDDSADDIAQEALLSAIKQTDKPCDPAKVRPWLYQILVCRVADHLRRRYARDRHERSYAETQSVGEDDGWRPLLAIEQQDLLAAAIGRLDDRYRDLLTLKYVEQWSYQRLAERFNESQRGIEYQITKAKEQLRIHLRAIDHEL